MAIRRHGLGDPRAFLFRFLSCFIPFCLLVSMFRSSVQIPKIQVFTYIIGTKYAF